MNVSFSLDLHVRNKEAKTGHVYIRCTLNRAHKRISTGVKIPIESWNNKTKRVKKSHPLADDLNHLLDEKVRHLVRAYEKLLAEDKAVSLDELIRSSAANTPINFFQFATDTKLAEIESSDKMGTHRRYVAVLQKLKKYTKGNLTLSRVNYGFIKDYSLYLKNTLGNSQDTVSSNLSVLRTIINEAIKRGLYTGTNPFDQLKLSYTDNTKEKLSEQEMARIFTTPLPDIPSLKIARDFFLACFLAEGTRAGDMMTMRKEHIIGSNLVFRQMKTSTKMQIFIVPELNEIFDRYKSEGPFLFPYLNGEEVVDEARINIHVTVVNKYLKELAKYCGIFKKLSTHVARHTWTDMALKATDGNIYEVQKSLGHTSVKTTETYSRKLTNYSRTSVVKDVVANIKKNQSK